MNRGVVVVGAGVVGLFSALYARRAGFEVTVVDRDGAERFTTSHGNIGLVVPSHFVPLAAPGAVAQGLRWMFDAESPFYVRPSLDPALLAWGWRFWRASSAVRARRAGPLLRDLHMASKAEYLELAERWGNPFDLTQSGLVMLCSTAEALEAEARTAAKALTLGLPARVLGRAEVQELEPGLTLDVVGGVYHPEDARLDPGLLVSRLQSRLAEMGVAFRWNTRVDGLERDGSVIRRLRLAAADGGRGAPSTSAPGEELEADAVVLAAGVWSGGLARSLGLRLPMRAGKGYSMTLAGPPERPATPAILSEGHVALSPLAGGVRIGGTMEITGVREGISESRLRGIKRSVKRALPAFGDGAFAGVRPWYGFRPTTPDGLPYLGRSARATNLVVATGHAMMGVSLAPVTGKLVGEVLQDLPASLPLGLLSPDRYA